MSASGAAGSRDVAGSRGVAGARGVAVVAGAAGGLGPAVVDALTAAGWTVAALDLPGDRLDELGRRDGVHAAGLDLTDRGAVHAAFADLDRLGPLHGLAVLVGGYRPGALADLDEEGFAAMWRPHVASVLWCCQAAAPRMAAAGGGSIVTVGSRSAVRGTGPVAHATSKAAVVRVSELLADELRPQGVRVNCVLPSVIDTPANREWMPPDLAARAVAPAAIAEVVAFLLGPASAPVSGARVPVDGDS